ncbi:Dephospho-CoA kinase [Dirofilaria immitis]|nr:Dephospho-CoA kinase [Dirofilaria immitis]
MRKKKGEQAIVTVTKYNMYLVGLTGGIATGKSTVSQIFIENHISIIDSDLIAREVVAPGENAYKKLRQHFDNEYFDSVSGEVLRKKLGNLVFSDENTRHLVNSIIHPEIRKVIAFRILQHFFRGEKFVVLDLPLLFEADIQLKRLQQRDNIDEEAAQKRIKIQYSMSDKRLRATHIVNNSGDIEETRVQDVNTSMERSGRRFRSKMDKKLTLIGELINEIKKSRNNSYCLQHEQLFRANIMVDDIIQKLINLRNLYNNISLNATKDGYYDKLLVNTDIQQYLPHHGNNIYAAQMVSVKAEALNNDDANLIEIAYHAFNNENYAKCVRTIERIATLQQSKLKSTTLDDSSNEALLCQIDWRSECLQERLKLTRCVNERMRISELLIVSLIEAYEVATQCMATFSVDKLKQRIDGLCSMISDYLRNFSELNKVSLVIEEGIELLRLIYNEAKHEFNTMAQNKPKNEEKGKNLMEIMNEINLVLQHCSWCDKSFIYEERIIPNHHRLVDQNNISMNELSSSDDLYHDDIIEARF